MDVVKDTSQISNKEEDVLPSEFGILLQEENFLSAIAAALENWKDVRVFSDIFHRQPNVFDGLKEIVGYLGQTSELQGYSSQIEKLKEIVRMYSCVGVFSPRISTLLKYSILFVVNGLASKKTDNIVLEEKDIKRLSTVYTTVILNITTNPKMWLGLTPEVNLVDWRKDIERGKIDRETFVAFRSYLRNKF